MEYGFPRQLYTSQVKLVEDVTSAIRENKRVIISSPTGTGKTLSLLCAATNFLKPTGEDDLYELLSSTCRTKIYYCSRTHSQLAQVINELKTCKNRYRSVILGSRKVYCVNDKLKNITDVDIMNERCKELIRDDTCKYYRKEYYSTEILDIEELKMHGTKECFCPYYYTKDKASDCEIVFLPYNLLFTREGRESIDITLKDKIIIIDEAHNIYDAVIQLNSAEITWETLRIISSVKGLSEDLKIIITGLQQFRSKVSKDVVYTVVNFLVECKLARFNMFEIVDFIEKSKLAEKNDLRCIFEFSKFLRLLTFSDDMGRIFANERRLRFSCINPKMYFEELKECKAVVFAGGTMEPISNLKSVFPDICYHSYPSVNDSFESVIITETVSGKQINLSFTNREQQIDDVVNTIVALSNPVISGGVIVFVPSKAFLELIKRSKKITNSTRKVSFEDEIEFNEFKNKPEILVAVMGGSLSEGVNFSDDVCRLLIVVGVPYPTRTLEIIERSKFMKHYEILVAMKTVNQAVGRAIRHKDDYAAIVLLDSRYQHLKDKLSPWLQSKTKICKFGPGLVNVNTFLKSAFERSMNSASTELIIN